MASAPCRCSASRKAAAMRSRASSQPIRSNWPEPLGPVAAQRVGQALGMVEPLSVAGDLRADHACRVGDALATAHLAQTAVRQLLDLERADRRAVVRAYGRVELAHRPCFRAGDAAVMMMWWHRLRRNLRGLARFRAQ